MEVKEPRIALWKPPEVGGNRARHGPGLRK